MKRLSRGFSLIELLIVVSIIIILITIAVSSYMIFYADQLTESIRKAVGETSRRRKIQTAFNKNSVLLRRRL